MNGQARELMAWVAQQDPATAPRRRGPLIIGVTSAKGGVGKSVIAVQLAHAIAQMGHSVGLLDANFGLSHIDLLAGTTLSWNLAHCLGGAQRVRDVVGISAHGVPLLTGFADWLEQPHVPASLRSEFHQLLSQWDHLVIDVGCGTHGIGKRLLAAVDVGVVVTTPDVSSIAATYSFLKSRGAQRPPLSLLINRAADEEEGSAARDRLRHTVRTFLHTELTFLEPIADDTIFARCALPGWRRGTGRAATTALLSLGRSARRLVREPRRGSLELLDRLAAPGAAAGPVEPPDQSFEQPVFHPGMESHQPFKQFA